jgi:hypothetical protein
MPLYRFKQNNSGGSFDFDPVAIHYTPADATRGADVIARLVTEHVLAERARIVRFIEKLDRKLKADGIAAGEDPMDVCFCTMLLGQVSFMIECVEHLK